jgi:hypothetical protein
MRFKNKLNAQQWQAICNGPFAVATFIGLASGNAMDLVAEMATVGKLMAMAPAPGEPSGYGELVDAVMAEMDSVRKADAQGTTMHYGGEDKDGKAMRAQARQVIVEASATVGDLPGADGYRRWLMEVARATALTKTGGIFGLGGKSEIDAKEQAAIDELAGILAISTKA